MVYIFVVLGAIILRLVPHMENMALITALAIFAGANLPKKQAIAVPLLARFISDIFIGFFAWKLMVAVYIAHLLGVLFGLWIKHAGGSPVSRWVRIFISNFGSAVVFFLITNFAFFYHEYTHDFAGVVLAYSNGLPFLRGTLLGDVAYTAALFGAYEFVRYYVGNRFYKRLSKINA